MLTLGRLAPGERLVDLGCGDGRLLRSAVADFGAQGAIGYELDPSLVRIALEAAAAEGLDGTGESDTGGNIARVVVREADAHQAGADGALASADLVTLYLSTQGNAALLPMLRRELRPSARVVSFHWEMPDELKPARVARMQSRAAVYLYEGIGERGGGGVG